MIMKKHHDHIIRLKMFFELQDAFYSCPRTVAQKHAFFLRKFTGIDGCILISYFCETVNDVKIHILGQDVLSYSFCDIWVDFIFIKLTRFMVFLKTRAVGIHSPNLDIRVLFF